MRWDKVNYPTFCSNLEYDDDILVTIGVSRVQANKKPARKPAGFFMQEAA
jgi:hypothetical protein